MKIYCLSEFLNEVERLKKKNSYSDIEVEISDHFFGKTIDQICNGNLLNASKDTPYIKKRLKGRGGYRLYCLLIIRDDSVYLMFVHPKTGSLGYESLSREKIKSLQKDLFEAIKSDDLFEVTFEGEKLDFAKKSKTTIPISSGQP